MPQTNIRTIDDFLDDVIKLQLPNLLVFLFVFRFCDPSKVQIIILGGGGGGGVLLGILGGGVPPGSSNHDPISDRNCQNLYPFSDQNGSKTIPFGAAHTYILI